jgi:hypothetical protein
MLHWAAVLGNCACLQFRRFPKQQRAAFLAFAAAAILTPPIFD